MRRKGWERFCASSHGPCLLLLCRVCMWTSEDDGGQLDAASMKRVRGRRERRQKNLQNRYIQQTKEIFCSVFRLFSLFFLLKEICILFCGFEPRNRGNSQEILRLCDAASDGNNISNPFGLNLGKCSSKTIKVGKLSSPSAAFLKPWTFFLKTCFRFWPNFTN